jgi:hypothetical protein
MSAVKPKPKIEPISVEYQARAANALGMLQAMRYHAISGGDPLDAAIEQLMRVPHAFNNAEARQCLAAATYLLPNVFGLRETKSG